MSIQDTDSPSILQSMSLPYNLDLSNLVNCLLTFMKTLTRDAVAHTQSWIKPIPEAVITRVNCCRGLLESGRVGGGKLLKGEENPLWATTWASEAFFSDGIRGRFTLGSRPRPWKIYGSLKIIQRLTLRNRNPFCNWWVLKFSVKWKWTPLRDCNVFYGQLK